MSFQDFGPRSNNRSSSSSSQQQQQQQHHQPAIRQQHATSSGVGGIRPNPSLASSSTGGRQQGGGGGGFGGIPPTSGGGGGDVLGQISETLLQYQRNVGILEKIAQSFLSLSSNRSGGGGGGMFGGGGSSNQREELDLQYRAQMDVIGQLEDKVRRQMQQQQQQQQQRASSSTTTAKTALIKLQRDFERVQARARQCKDQVERIRSTFRASAGSGRGAAGAGGMSPATVPVAGGLDVIQGAQQGQQQTDEHFQQMQMQMQQDRLNEEIMREREEEIRNINRGMVQVNEIYKDLAHIVGSQQEQVDTIETQMEDAKTNAVSGLQQVEKANEKFGNTQCTIS